MVPLALDPPEGKKSPNYNTILLRPSLSFFVPSLPSTVPSTPPFRAPPETCHNEETQETGRQHQPSASQEDLLQSQVQQERFCPKPGVVPCGPETPRKPDPEGQLRYAGQEAEG